MTSSDSSTTGKVQWAERLVFASRPLVMLFMMLVTALLAWQATQLKVAASFEKMIPSQHEYVVNFLKNRAELSGLGNVVRITVQAKQGDIFTPQ